MTQAEAITGNWLGDSYLREAPFGENTALDRTLNHAIWNVNDAGIWADVHRMRVADIQLRELVGREAHVKMLEDFALQERHAYIRAKEVVQNEREKASRRLLESHATA
jgi:hypothetical protein